MEENAQYFGEREEKAVIDYINSDSYDIKNDIYNNILLIPFTKMIQSILRRYPIYIGTYSMYEIEVFALSHLIEHMVKFNPDKITKSGNKTKAFSYCQTIVRNYFKDLGKKLYNDKLVNLSYDDYCDDIDENIKYSYELSFETQHYLEKLIDIITDRISELIESSDDNLKKNEIIVGDAIVNILKNWHILFMEDTPNGNYNKRVSNKFAKNKILLFIKEQTGLTTKEIRVGIKPFKEIYFIEKIAYLNEL